jgi:hypothetical protein
MPSWGIASAAATLVGQNLGARKPERSERAVWTAGVYNMVFLAGVAVCFFLAARPLVGLFTTDAAVAPVAVACLRYVSLGYPFYAWGMIMEQAFNGAGDTATPTWMNFFCYWLLQIPLAWLLAEWAGAGTARRVPGHLHCRIGSGGGRNRVVPAREVEAGEGVGRALEGGPVSRRSGERTANRRVRSQTLLWITPGPLEYLV